MRLLFVGNILPRKRVLELVKAFAALACADVQLVLVGAELSPGYAQEVRAVIEQAKLASRVHWLGSIDAAGVAAQLSLAEVLVLPSALEGYGMVLSEALWSGVPIIAARVGAAGELVSRTSAGLLYEPDDPNGLDARAHSLRRRSKATSRFAARRLALGRTIAALERYGTQPYALRLRNRVE